MAGEEPSSGELSNQLVHIGVAAAGTGEVSQLIEGAGTVHRLNDHKVLSRQADRVGNVGMGEEHHIVAPAVLKQADLDAGHEPGTVAHGCATSDIPGRCRTHDAAHRGAGPACGLDR